MRRPSDLFKEIMNACPYSSNAHLSDDEKLDQLIIGFVFQIKSCLKVAH